jgi:hypothetical protein
MRPPRGTTPAASRGTTPACSACRWGLSRQSRTLPLWLEQGVQLAVGGLFLESCMGYSVCWPPATVLASCMVYSVCRNLWQQVLCQVYTPSPRPPSLSDSQPSPRSKIVSSPHVRTNPPEMSFPDAPSSSEPEDFVRYVNRRINGEEDSRASMSS